jgi:hypothetical protein
MTIYYLIGKIFYFIGGFLRWIFGYTKATIIGKEKFSLKEYLYGIENSESGYEHILHGANNYIIGIIFIVLIIYLFS